MRKAAALPYLPYYVADWAHKTARMSLAERGALIALIEFYWPVGSLPSDEAQLARLVRATPEEWKAIAPAVLAMFEIDGNKLHNTTLDELWRKSADISEKAKISSNLAVEAKARKRLTLVEQTVNRTVNRNGRGQPDD